MIKPGVRSGMRLIVAGRLCESPVAAEVLLESRQCATPLGLRESGACEIGKGSRK